MDTVPLLPVAPISSSTAHNLDGTSLLQSSKHALGFAISHIGQRLKSRPSPYWAPNEPCVVNRKVARPHQPVGYLQRCPAWTELFSILAHDVTHLHYLSVYWDIEGRMDFFCTIDKPWGEKDGVTILTNSRPIDFGMNLQRRMEQTKPVVLALKIHQLSPLVSGFNVLNNG
jgi:hypothetical protein